MLDPKTTNVHIQADISEFVFDLMQAECDRYGQSMDGFIQDAIYRHCLMIQTQRDAVCMVPEPMVQIPRKSQLSKNGRSLD